MTERKGMRGGKKGAGGKVVEMGVTAAESGLRDVLLDSRQRWRDLVALAGDLVVETDASGRITFADPDPVLGYTVAELLGKEIGSLFAAPVSGLPDPFAELTPGRRRLWFRRRDGRLVCLLLAYRPLFDGAGRLLGHRALGIDVTAEEESRADLAARLGRALAIEHILWHIRQEVQPGAMARAGLNALAFAIGANGGAVVELRRTEEGDWSPDFIRHASAEVPETFLERALEEFCRPVRDSPLHLTAEGGEPLLLIHCPNRMGEPAGLLFWRTDPTRPFLAEEAALVASCLGIFRLVLEQESVQEDILRQAHTDPLTGLLNRRAFHDEVARRLPRLARERLPATMVFLDLDHFKSINDRFGHEAGDRVLLATAALLRDNVRPTDLVARFGGDEFAIFLDGADSYAASERAEALCHLALAQLGAALGAGVEKISFSVGLAMCWPQWGGTIEELLQRADAAMYEAKRAGGGHWRLAASERGERR